jgi:threonine/homoserine/homoserine lactone efflux protein
MMLSLFTIFISSFVIALSGAMMPGPLLTVTISESSHRGFIAGPLLILGHSILELILIVGLVLGLSPILQLKGVFIGISLIGGIILFLMAIKMFLSLSSLKLTSRVSSNRRQHLFITGILMSLANPYWTIWWATIGLSYIIHCRTAGFAGLLSFYFGHISGDMVWYSAISLTVGKGRRFLNDRIYRVIIGACAVFLIVFGSYFLYSGFLKIIK